MFVCAVSVVAYSCGGGSDNPVAPVTPKWPAPDLVPVPHVSGFPAMVVPEDNPLTKQGISLGRRLFYDPILSGDSTEACATCHEFGRSFADDRRFSIGIDNIEGNRNAPALPNAGWISSAFWDGRAATLEDQALQPVVNPIEMHSTWDGVVDRIQNNPDYPDLFGRAFGTDQITKELVVKAIAQFERTFVSANSKYDRYLRGEVQLTASEARGEGIFFTEKGDCFHCHGNPMRSDQLFHNVGLDSLGAPGADLGRGDITGNPNDLMKFKTPTLRNIEATPPYMHDGRFQTLEEVVQHYNMGGFPSPTKDALVRNRGIGLGLTAQEVQDVVAFLKTFTDPEFINNPDYDNPFKTP